MSRRRTADEIEESKSAKMPRISRVGKKHKKHTVHPNSLKNLVAPWGKGEAPKSAGRPVDTAAKIARLIFQQNEEAIYGALAKSLLSGNAYVFKELAERGFGKLTDKVQVTGDAELIAKLEAGRKRLLEPEPK
jgi:hypothetical protein